MGEASDSNVSELLSRVTRQLREPIVSAETRDSSAPPPAPASHGGKPSGLGSGFRSGSDSGILVGEDDRVSFVRGSAGSVAGAQESVLLATAARYCPTVESFTVTPPTGFDFEAGALFEAIVESAFLVANADGHFDDVERQAFTQVVREASGKRVSERQIAAIVLDLTQQLQDDGLERRCKQLRSIITKHVHRREALLVATFLAEVSAGVSESERRVLEVLAQAFELPSTMVDEALTEVRKSLAG